MPSNDENWDIQARLIRVERQVSTLKVWLVILGLGLLISLFGSTAWRLWQINVACNTIIEKHPNLSHSECMKRVNTARANDQDTIRVD